MNKRFELARTAGILNGEHAVVALIDKSLVDELAHEARRHFPRLVFLLELFELLLKQLDLYRLRLFIHFLLRGRFLIGLDLGLSSAPLAAHL